MPEKSHDMRRLIFRLRGLFNILWLAGIVLLMLQMGLKPTPMSFAAGYGIVVIGQVMRTWCAGYIGPVARAMDTGGERLVTAGPYAYSRNPMHFGIFIMGIGVCIISGTALSLLIFLPVFTFTYLNVFSYEEAYLSKKFPEYEHYFQSVPRFFPALRRYEPRKGRFDMRLALSNEIAAIPGTILLGFGFGSWALS